MIVLIMLMAVSPSYAKVVTYTWCAAIDGTPAIAYNVQINVSNAGWVDLGVTEADESGGSWLLDVPIGVIIMRVQGVDANGNVGPWSPTSDPYEYEGEPGMACKPVWND